MGRTIGRDFAVALMAASVFAARGAEDPRADKVFVGYLYGEPRDVNFGLYTHLCHAFVLPDADGRLGPSRGVPDRKLTAAAHHAGVKVLVSLGGWGYDRQFAAIVARPEAEERFVREVVRLVDEADYDGIDLDWEYPDTRLEVEGFQRLTRRFRHELDVLGKNKGRRLLMTMAASANPGTLRWLNRETLLETMDWINVMTYDYAGDWTPYAGHHAPLFAAPRQPKGRPLSSAGTIAHLREDMRIPSNYLALGIPLYGRGFAVGEPYLPTKNAPAVRMPRGEFSNLQILLREQRWTRTWDDAAKVPWLSSPDHAIVIGYDDPESAAIKAKWAVAQGLRGVFFWQIDGDRLPDGTNPVQTAARRAFDAGAAARRRAP
jgi:chitinase